MMIMQFIHCNIRYFYLSFFWILDYFAKYTLEAGGLSRGGEEKAAELPQFNANILSDQDIFLDSLLCNFF